MNFIKAVTKEDSAPIEVNIDLVEELWNFEDGTGKLYFLNGCTLNIEKFSDIEQQVVNAGFVKFDKKYKTESSDCDLGIVYINPERVCYIHKVSDSKTEIKYNFEYYTILEEKYVNVLDKFGLTKDIMNVTYSL